MNRTTITTAALLLSFALPAGATNWGDIQRVESAIERLGAKIYWSRMNTGVCAERGLLGFYRPSERTVYMCQQAIRDSGDSLISTLRHEGWHAVQHLCNDSRAVLTDDKIRAMISHSDKRSLRSNYDADMHRLEAEARAVERIPTPAYLRGVNHYCS